MDYRFVTLTSSGQAGHGEYWSCPSDAEAMARASSQVPSFGAELWRGDQRLGVFAGPLSRTQPEKRSSSTH